MKSVFEDVDKGKILGIIENTANNKWSHYHILRGGVKLCFFGGGFFFWSYNLVYFIYIHSLRNIVIFSLHLM